MKLREFAYSLLVFALPNSAFAGWDNQLSFTVTPLPAHAGQALNLRVESEAGCFIGGPDAFVSRSGSDVTVKFYAADHACPDSFRTPLMAPIGAFAEGAYSLSIELCPSPPLPAALAAQPLVVGPPLRQRIPALSTLALGSLGMSMLATLLPRARRAPA